jgi:hypothetical protein
MSKGNKKIYLKFEQDFIKLPKCGYYHIQVHFKRSIQRSRGSIEFDKSKCELTEIVKNILSCKKFECEDRWIHPANINRISVCMTNCKKDDIFQGQVVIAPRSQKYDYLYEYAIEKEGHIINIMRSPCYGIGEWFRIYWLILIIPIASTIVAISIFKFLYGLENKDVITISITIGVGLLGLTAYLERK